MFNAKLNKTLRLLNAGGLMYLMVELLWRGHTHWSMYLVGGLCFICIGLLNEIFPWNMPLLMQLTLAAIEVTVIELVAGLIINIGLGWNVWDYSNMPFNILGQVCLPYMILWFFLAFPAILLDDYLKHKRYNYPVPKYIWFK